ncbi:MAG: hypothetical protein WC812_00645 [Candidatus Pacearchaeota archaeon]|jgi:hypothetical protein
MPCELLDIKSLFCKYDLILLDTCAIKNSLETICGPITEENKNKMVLEEIKSYHFWSEAIKAYLNEQGEIIICQPILNELKNEKSLSFKVNPNMDLNSRTNKIIHEKILKNYGLNTKCCEEEREKFMNFIKEREFVLNFDEREKIVFNLISTGIFSLKEDFPKKLSDADYSLVISAITLSKIYKRVCVVSNDKGVNDFLKELKKSPLVNGNLQFYFRNSFDGFSQYFKLNPEKVVIK